MRTGAPHSHCLTTAGGESIGNPKEDWLLRAGTTWTEYRLTPRWVFVPFEGNIDSSGMACSTLRVLGPIAGGHGPEDKQAGSCLRAPARRGPGGHASTPRGPGLASAQPPLP